MTKAEWLACTDPQRMLGFLGGKASTRKLWLFSCGACRCHQVLMADKPCRTVIELGERFADGEATYDELEEAGEIAYTRQLEEGVQTATAKAATFAVICPSERDPNLPSITVLETVRYTSNDLTDLASFDHGIDVELASQCALLRCVFGNPPFRRVTLDPCWLTPTVKQMAEKIYDERAFDRLPILGDALEEAGCTAKDILSHCRGPGPHVRGCWVVDLILGKE